MYSVQAALGPLLHEAARPRGQKSGQRQRVSWPQAVSGSRYRLFLWGSPHEIPH
jgi:hypothetical protein